jgi:hypothetical protein
VDEVAATGAGMPQRDEASVARLAVPPAPDAGAMVVDGVREQGAGQAPLVRAGGHCHGVALTAAAAGDAAANKPPAASRQAPTTLGQKRQAQL